jgi:outer membrane biosynthesis protein TonB
MPTVYHTKAQIMGILDDLLNEFETNTGTMPQVNPPEAAAVVAAQTAPEVAGTPEPAPVEEAPPAPTEKPAELKATEAATKTRKPRASKAAAPAAPEGWDNAPSAMGASKITINGQEAIGPIVNLSTVPTELLRDELKNRGWSVSLAGG